MTLAPLPVAPRPLLDETLRSWADRVGQWYALDGTQWVYALRQRDRMAPPLEDSWSSLAACEQAGATPAWILDILAQTTRVPRSRLQARVQDDDARWTPGGSFWQALAQRPRRCRHCVAVAGTVHDRRPWRCGWLTVCADHHCVLDTVEPPPCPYAVALEQALERAVHQPPHGVQLPWPVQGQCLHLPLPLWLTTLATLAESLCDQATTLVPGTRDGPQHAAGVRLIDIAATAAGVPLASRIRDKARLCPRWRCRHGLTGAQHHALLASLGWLLADWPVPLFSLLQADSLDSLRAATAVASACGLRNIDLLAGHAQDLAWPLWKWVCPDPGEPVSPAGSSLGGWDGA